MKNKMLYRMSYLKNIAINVFGSLYSKLEPVKYVNSLLFKLDEIEGSDRDSQDRNVLKFLKKVDRLKKEGVIPTISAIYRVKNGAEYIELSILSIAPLVSEIIVVDNTSTDETYHIVKRLQGQLKDTTTIKLYQYTKKVELAGGGYDERVKKNPSGSLAEFYRYCFALGKSQYLLKCDAHYVFSAKGLHSIISALKSEPDYVLYSGLEVYGKKMGFEPFLFKNDDGYSFIDTDKYEKLVLKGDVKVRINEPVFLHLKRISYTKSIALDIDALEHKYN
ncbi:glycosyltransferase [Aeromonas veronii]|uniref:glycosyltransferase n=1 Tax=Aeromonas veronii TaxID=654 RepID=UPI00300524A4